MPSRLDARLRRLEAKTHEEPPGQGLAALLEWGRRNGVEQERLPLAALADAELDTKIVALASQRGLSLLLREHYEKNRARRQAALAQEPPACPFP